MIVVIGCHSYSSTYTYMTLYRLYTAYSEHLSNPSHDILCMLSVSSPSQGLDILGGRYIPDPKMDENFHP